MAKKRKITSEEQLVLDEFMKGIETLSLFTSEVPSEVPSLKDLGFDARVQLFKRIHEKLGSNQTKILIQYLQCSNDADFRSPK